MPDPSRFRLLVLPPTLVEEIDAVLRAGRQELRRDRSYLRDDVARWIAEVAADAAVVRQRRVERMGGLSLDRPGLSSVTMPDVDEMITVAEAAKRRGCSKSAITKRIRKGTLKARPGGRGYLVPASAFPKQLRSPS